MTKTYKTIRECAELWVSQMNAIPRSMIEKLINQNPDEWSEVTKPDVDDRVYQVRRKTPVFRHGDISRLK